MNVAAALAIVAATLNLGAAGILAFLSHVPGWRMVRLFAAVAFAAGIYNCSGVVFATPGLPDTVYILTGRVAYLAGHLGGLLWLVLAFGEPDTSWRRLPIALRGFITASALVAALFALTGLNLADTVDVVRVPWAGAEYHLALTTAAGDWYGAFILVQFAAVYVQLIRRAVAGDRDQVVQIVAFSIFFATSVLEYLVAHRRVVFLSLGDIGMLVLVIPIARQVIRRFVADAEHLERQRGQLAGTVREQTAWRDRAQVALAESERMAALGRLAAGVGHEINNPLTYLTLSLGEVETYLASLPAPNEIMAAVSHAKDGATRIQRVAERLRGYSRRHEERTLVDLRDVVSAATRVAAPTIDPTMTVTFAFGNTPRVLADESRLVQACVNVLTNAAQAVRARAGASTIRVNTSTNPLGQAIIAIEDDGVGVKAEHVGRLGEPYFTTRADQGGLGLGLFVTRGIVDAHGGQVDVQSSPGAGCVVRLILPGVREPAVAPAVPVRSPAPTPTPEPRTADILPFPSEPAGQRSSILLVDDEPLVTKLLATILQRTWEVVVADNAPEALERMAARRFDAVLCDLMMPGMSGIDLAGHLEQSDPWHRGRMLFLTGGAVTAEAEEFLARADVRHLIKPVARPDLLAALEPFRGQRT